MVINISKTAVPGIVPIKAIETNKPVSMIELKMVLPYALIKGLIRAKYLFNHTEYKYINMLAYDISNNGTYSNSRN